MDTVTGRLGRMMDLRMAWRYGGPPERVLVAMVVASPLTVLMAFLVANTYLLLAQMVNRAAMQVNVVVLMAALSWPILQPGIKAPMYSNAYYREAIRQRWLSPLQREYAAEIIRYREAIDAVRRPDNLTWAWALVLFYHASVWGSVVFALACFPQLGTWTWTTFALWYVPLAVVVWRFFWRRMREQGDAAARMGFHMREIGARMLDELREERGSHGKHP